MRQVALLLLFLAALLGAPARALPNPETSPQAQELLFLLLEGNYIQARQKAQDWLRRDPRHPVPLFAMGVVLYEAEGNLPRAYHCLSQARRLLREGWGEPVQGPVYLHQQVLQYLIRVTAEADRYQEEIQLLDDWERFDYYPKMTASYGWPLMKLGRLEEARRKMRQAMQDSLLWAEAANSLAAIEFEAGNYGQSLDWMRQLHRRYGADATTCCNVGEVMLAQGLYGPAEREFLEGSRYFRRLTYSNPWEYLVDLYTAQNRLPEALGAVKRMNAWSQSRAPQLIQQDWAELQAAQALALLAAGVDERALKVMSRVLDRPDRRGGTSVQAHQAEAGHLMLYYVILGQHRQRLAEEMSWSDWGPWLRLGWQRRQAARQRFEARSRAAALLVSHGEVALSLRPYGPRRVLSEWLLPTFNEVLGPGVTAAEVRRLLSRDDEQGRRERPFLLAVLGEGLWQRGRVAEARKALEEARAGLPAEEVLLRLRVSALLARLYEREGRTREALALYQEVLETHPATFRLLGLALPVSLRATDEDSARQAAAWLGGSPRFRRAAWGFPLEVSGLAAVLKGLDGSLLGQARVEDRGDHRETARQLCRQVHERFFTTPLNLSQVDIRSLDGSNTRGQGLRGVLE